MTFFVTLNLFQGQHDGVRVCHRELLGCALRAAKQEMSNFLRNKAVVTLIVLLCLGIVLGMVANRYSESGKSWWLQDAITTVVGPINSAAHSIAGVFDGFVGIFRSRASMATENTHLRNQVKQLEMENSKLREAAYENVSLRQALGLRQSTSFPTIAAEVISRSESSWFDTATVNRGSNSGVEKGGAVFNHLGLIGQIVDVNPMSSQMVFLTDQNSAVGGMVQRSRSAGMVQGQGADDLVLTYLPKDADVKVGDLVVSSGMGKVIPKGIPIGRVIQVVANSLAGTTSALLKPSARYDQVEQVLIARVGQGSE